MIIHPDSAFREMTYDDYGNKLTETDELGHTTVWTYDEFNRILTQTDPLGHTTRYEYGDPSGGSGTCACNTENHPTRIISSSGKITEFVYDHEWQKIKEIHAAGSDDVSTNTFIYNAVGNVITNIDARGKTWVLTLMPFGNSWSAKGDVDGAGPRFILQ